FFFSSRRRHTRFSRDWSSDVCSSDLQTEQQLALYRKLGYDFLAVSAKSGVGMQQLLDYLHSGTSIFVGQSGVGKSSLMNHLMPRSEERRVGKEWRDQWAA